MIRRKFGEFFLRFSEVSKISPKQVFVFIGVFLGNLKVLATDQMTGVGTRDAQASKNSKELMVAASEAVTAAAQPQTAKLGPRSSAESSSQSF